MPAVAIVSVKTATLSAKNEVDEDSGCERDLAGRSWALDIISSPTTSEA